MLFSLFYLLHFLNLYEMINYDNYFGTKGVE